MKKGFTLVELSIVLVIIGILMGMTVKGRALIETARIKRELVKIRNAGIAYNAYWLDDGYPTWEGNGTASFQPLIDAGMMSEQDIHINYKQTYSSRMSLFRCVIEPRPSDPDFNRYGIHWSPTWRDVCISIELGEQLSCHYEVMMDDENRLGGDGRISHSSIADTNPPNPANFNNCNGLPDGYLLYGVRVF